jgi:hypothetical protein
MEVDIMNIFSVILIATLLTLNNKGTQKPEDFRPVKILSYQEVASNIFVTRSALYSLPAVSFMIRGSKVVDYIKFKAFSGNGITKTYFTQGRFSPGILIKGRILTPYGSSTATAHDKQGFYPIYAHFLDGTSWVDHTL